MAAGAAVLPISNPQTTTSTTSAIESAPISTPAFRAFLTNTSESLRSGLAQRRPWSELVDRTSFSKPDSISDATLRIRKNYAYFRVNYLSLISLVLAFSLLTNPLSLLTLLSLLSAWLFLYLFRPSDPPLVVFGRVFSERETFLALVVSTIVVVFLTSVGSVLISAFLIGALLVCAHAAFRVPDDLFLDEAADASASTGFLSFLGGSNAAASVATVVAARG